MQDYTNRNLYRLIIQPKRMRKIINRCIIRVVLSILLLAGLLPGSTQQIMAAGDPGIEDAPLVSKLTGTALMQNATAVTSFASGTQSGYTIRNIIMLRVV